MSKSTAKKKSSTPHKPSSGKRTTNPDIFRFIDFFVKTGEKILGKKPQIIRGKDGKLTMYALRKIPISKLETLVVWFLAKKKNLHPLIATMLSQVVLEELMREMSKSAFWKEIDHLMDMYYPRKTTMILWQPFTHKDITAVKEEIAKTIRKL